MNATELKLEYSVCEKKKGGIPVIIVAAGASTRMQGVNKQFVSLLGIPVIARTLAAFENSPQISKIIIVTTEHCIPEMQLICEKYMISKLTDIVSGGATRHESVMQGISRLDINDTKVLIHDGARPLVDGDTIFEVVQALEEFDAAVCVCKINDTVKSVDDNGMITATVDRSCLYSALTPQGVDVKKYLSACEQMENIDSFTDDVSIMEAAGFSVKAVMGSRKNIKITTPEDVFIAEAFVKGEVGQ